MSQSAIAAEMNKDFALDFKDALRQEISLATKIKGKIRDLVNVASRVISQSIRRQDQEFKAADPRFIQATRGLYKKSLAHLADLEATRHASLEKRGNGQSKALRNGRLKTKHGQSRLGSNRTSIGKKRARQQLLMRCADLVHSPTCFFT